LEQLIQVLNDPDAGHLGIEQLPHLKRFVTSTRQEINQILFSEAEMVDDNEFEDAQEDPSPKRFQPTVVAASGFGNRPSSLPRAEPQSRSGVPGLYGKTLLTKRMKWSNEEVEQLRIASEQYPYQWEEMRRNFPMLHKFTGVQLKDKFRATFGSRSSQ
jgi:hypothetical protein